jgi:phasin family protein
MYPFSQSVNPAIRTHIDAQTAYLNDMSKMMFRSFQQLCDLNIQLVQTLLEEGTLAGRQLLTADGHSAMLSAAASRAQPTTEKLRAYQQHVSRLAADAQVELARVTEQHAQNTARTARAVADEVARTATEQTERGMHTQQESMRRFADPFARAGDAAAAQSQMWAEARAPQTMQSAGQQGSSQGGQQQGVGQGSQQQGMGQGSQQQGMGQGSQQQGPGQASQQCAGEGARAGQ